MLYMLTYPDNGLCIFLPRISPGPLRNVPARCISNNVDEITTVLQRPPDAMAVLGNPETPWLMF